jgi:hypothetical protein
MVFRLECDNLRKELNSVELQKDQHILLKTPINRFTFSNSGKEAANSELLMQEEDFIDEYDYAKKVEFYKNKAQQAEGLALQCIMQKDISKKRNANDSKKEIDKSIVGSKRKRKE